ncbi:RNA-binding protein 41-like [Palaemon carinicauda]|uniref:RNA-binding protein 41-like n=1 Tax=Palaemon carinicauda TaxID=392227 RepID=UPI0035B59D8E
MASLTDSNAVKYRHLGQEELQEKEKVETLRDKILKGYLQKQLRTHESLEDCKRNQRIFCQASVEQSFTANTEGLTSYNDFKELQSSLDVKQVLRSCGLSEDEIKLLQNEGEDSSSESPVARKERLRIIEEKLQSRQQQLDSSSVEFEQFSGAIPLNRHDFEEEINSIPTNEKADKLTACLVRLQPHHDDSIPADHPINHIKEIAEELFPSKSDTDTDKTNLKKRNCNWISTEESQSKCGKFEVKHIYLKEKPKSFWDMKEIPKIIESCEVQGNRKATIGTSEVEDKLVVRKQEKVIKCNASKPFVLTLEDKELIPLELIKSNKKTLDELRGMEKFKNYKEGEPSGTLYIKNLSHKTSPHDLASFLGHFESKTGPKILYRILNGRMRGQAFVTFHDKSTAEVALKTCNGYILHGRPVIMEFSRQ